MAFEMEKEIFEQPVVLSNLISKYITNNDTIVFSLPENIRKIKFIASGSSYHCAHMVSKLFREYANIKTYCEYSSEFFISKNLFIDPNTLYVFISQSGETYDTVEALKKVKTLGGITMCVTNCENSSLWNLCDYKILSEAGEEKSIASTKALLAQIFCLYLIMLKYLAIKNHDIKNEISEIKKLPLFVENFLATASKIKNIAKKLSKCKNIVILGSKYYYSVAKEGALKIKETSYINANAYPQGEFLHGHVAILNNAQSALIAICVEETKENTNQILNKIFESYSPEVITISNVPETRKNAINIQIDTENNIFTLLATVITFQLLAFETACELGRNVDKPLGLKKVVK